MEVDEINGVFAHVLIGIYTTVFSSPSPHFFYFSNCYSLVFLLLWLLLHTHRERVGWLEERHNQLIVQSGRNHLQIRLCPWIQFYSDSHVESILQGGSGEERYIIVFFLLRNNFLLLLHLSVQTTLLKIIFFFSSVHLLMHTLFSLFFKCLCLYACRNWNSLLWPHRARDCFWQYFPSFVKNKWFMHNPISPEKWADEAHYDFL